MRRLAIHVVCLLPFGFALALFTDAALWQYAVIGGLAGFGFGVARQVAP